MSVADVNVPRMAYDEDLAYRIRELVAAERGVEEKRMFGGLAFLINGNMSVVNPSIAHQVRGGFWLCSRTQSAVGPQ